MGAFKDKILDELEDNNYLDLYKTIDSIDNDVDVANYLASNKAYFSRKFKTEDLEGMPEFRKAIYSDVKTGKVDLDREFGKDWDKKYANIPYDEIVYVADKQGVNPKQLLKQMETEAVARDRKRIAHGEWDKNLSLGENLKNELSGSLLSLFGRRQQEAIERGEDPSWKDYLGDVGEQALYMIPYGRGVGAITRGGRISRLLSGAASNVTAPLASEVYDSQVYDESNPRGEFSGADVGTGVAVNVTAPWLLRGGLMGVGKLTGNRGITKNWMEYANSQSAKELAEEINEPYSKYTPGKKSNPSISKSERDVARQMESLNNTDPDSYAAYINDTYHKIAQEEGTTLQEKANKFLKKFKDHKYKFILSDGNVVVADNTDDLLKLIQMNETPPLELTYPQMNKEIPTISDKFVEGWDKSPFSATEGLKSGKQLAGEEAVKNYLTNEYGSVGYTQQSPYTRIPFGIGQQLDAYMKQKAKEEEEQKIKEDIYKKWRIILEK